MQPCQEWRAAKSLCQRLQPRLNRLLQQLDRSHFTPSRALYPACLTQCSWPGYRHIMASFLCNMQLFPGMHAHLLLLLTDDDTATFLRAFGQRIAMFVARQHLQESHDYDSAGYLQLMLARGALLVQVLHEAEKQGKTVVWLEPDFRYTQNLLARAKMTHATSDVVLLSDHFSYCRCFIRFSPAPASRDFYNTVMHRMRNVLARGGSTNDQILLNELVAEQRVNFTVLHRCLYRSATFYTDAYKREYQLACQGVLPVAQALQLDGRRARKGANGKGARRLVPVGR